MQNLSTTNFQLMKTIAILLLVLSVSASCLASIDPIDVVMLTDPTSNTSVIRSTTPVSQATHLALADQWGTEIHNAEVAAGDFFSLRFAAGTLPKGSYVLLISDTRGRTRLPFEYHLSFITYDPNEGTRTVYPRFTLRDDRQLIVSYSANSESDLRVVLTDANGDAVFQDEHGQAARARKAFQLNQLSAGVYTLTVADNGHHLHSQELRLE